MYGDNTSQLSLNKAMVRYTRALCYTFVNVIKMPQRVSNIVPFPYSSYGHKVWFFSMVNRNKTCISGCIYGNVIRIVLQWRSRKQRFGIRMTSHECHSVSNHRQINCLFTTLFRLRTKKTSKLCITLGQRYTSDRHIPHSKVRKIFHPTIMAFILPLCIFTLQKKKCNPYGNKVLSIFN